MNISKSDTTTACMIYFTRCSLSDYMFRLSSLGHHQVVSLYRGNYAMYNMTQYVQRDRVQNELHILHHIIIIISFMQGIYTHIPETNYVTKEYSVAAILLFLFMVLTSLVPVLNLLYCTFTLVLSEVCVHCPIWLFSVVP